LVDAEEQETEEDIEVRVLDVSFHPLATAVRSSRASPPVLSDNGEIQVVSAGKSRWRIVEQSWGTQSQVLAAVNSGCRPETTSLSPDFLFIVGCERQNTDKWYRVLRPNGKPVLKGSSSKAELEQRASGLATGNAFAIGLAKAAKSIAAESAFSASDLESERISVYRSDNGERMLAISVPSPVTAVQSFVLSPDGNQLAVLSGEQIAFYDVPAAGPRR
jgi:hypothetical protein